MEKSGSRLNKPFDRVMKDLVEEEPRLLLELVAIVPPRASVVIKPLAPDTAPPVALPDFVAELVPESGSRYIGHVEFLAWYRSSYGETMARYGGSLAWQYRLVVESILLLVRPDGVPEVLPESGELVIGKTRITHPFRTVKLWELDPAPVMEAGNLRLYPWAVLMRSSDELVREIAGAIARQDDEEIVARFLTLGSIRYDRRELEEMAGGKHMSFVEAILEGSSLVQDVKRAAAERAHAEGHSEGLAEGLAEGRVEEARRLLRRAMASRFPGLENLPAIDGISSAEVLEALLFDTVLSEGSRDVVERAVLAASRQAG